MIEGSKDKKNKKDVKKKKVKKIKQIKKIMKILYEDQKRLDLIKAENKIEEEILECMKEIYPKYISAKEVSFLLSAGKNIAYEEEYLLIFIRISSTRKKIVAKSLLILIREKNYHEVVLNNLMYLIKERKEKLGI